MKVLIIDNYPAVGRKVSTCTARSEAVDTGVKHNVLTDWSEARPALTLPAVEMCGMRGRGEEEETSMRRN